MSENEELKPAAESAQPPAEADKTAQMRVELLEAKNRELISEKQAVKSQFEEMQAQITALQSQNSKAKQAKLAEAGEYQQLWKEANESNSKLSDEIATLQKSLETERSMAQEQQIKASTINAFTQNGVHSPEHLFNLMKDQLRMKDGGVVSVHGGVERPLAEALQSLKSPGSGFDYFFNGTGARGMGAVGSTPADSVANQDNPYVTGNFTQICQLELDEPERARQLKAQAKARAK